MQMLRRISVLLATALLVPLAVAQSSSPFLLTAPPAVPHVHIFQFDSGSGASIEEPFRLRPFAAPVRSDALKLSLNALPGLAAASQNLFQAQLSRNGGSRTVTYHRSSLCYAMRSYDFTIDPQGSDAARLTGSSTCQPAVRAELKPVEDPRLIAPR